MSLSKAESFSRRLSAEAGFSGALFCAWPGLRLDEQQGEPEDFLGG